MGRPPQIVFDSEHISAGFKCYDCAVVLPTPDRRKDHVKLVHPGPRCHVCNVLCGTAKALMKHVKKRHEPATTNPLVCNRCGVECQSERGVRRHKLIHHALPTMRNYENRTA